MRHYPLRLILLLTLLWLGAALRAEIPFPDWQQIKASYQKALKQFEQIKQLAPSQYNYENTFAHYEHTWMQTATQARIYPTLNLLYDTPEARQTKLIADQVHQQFIYELSKDQELYNTFKLASEQEWAKKLKPEQKRNIQLVLQAFKEYGLHLKPEDKLKLKQLLDKANQLGQQISQNIHDANQAWGILITDENLLQGLNADWKEQAAQAAKAQGWSGRKKWLITAQTSSYISVLQDCQNSFPRHLVWNSRRRIGQEAPYDNEALLHRLAQVRQETAQLQGYNNYADYTNKHSMLDSAAKARAFLQEVQTQLIPLYQKELAQLTQFAQSQPGHNQLKGELQPWDYMFYDKLYYLHSLNIGHFNTSDYFELEAVLQDMFAIAEKLFQIEIRHLPNADTWAEHVRAYEIYDKKSNTRWLLPRPLRSPQQTRRRMVRPPFCRQQSTWPLPPRTPRRGTRPQPRSPKRRLLHLAPPQ